jgi:hypothetical protein
MTVNGLRAALIAASVSLPLVVGVEAAQAACSNPSLGVSEAKAKQGDRVAFEISDTTPGAEYLLKVGDEELKSGTASGSSVSGSFKMPNLGEATHPAQVQAVLAHDECENSPWKVREAITYQVASGKKTSGPVNQRLGQNPLAVQLRRLRQQQRLQNAKRQEEARKRAEKQREKQERQQAKKKRVAAKLQAAARKQREKQARQQRAQQRALQKQLEAARRQREEKSAPKKKTESQSEDATTVSQRRGSGGEGSKPFIALGLLYALLGGLGGGGFLLYRRSQSGKSAPADVDAAPPLAREFGEEFELPSTKKPAPVNASGENGEAPEAPDSDLSEEEAAAEKERLEAELRRVFTEAGIDAEVDGILADVQAEAERRGVPVDANLMMQLLCGGEEGQANLSEPAEGRLRSKLEAIVAEEKERLALQHPES